MITPALMTTKKVFSSNSLSQILSSSFDSFFFRTTYRKFWTPPGLPAKTWPGKVTNASSQLYQSITWNSYQYCLFRCLSTASIFHFPRLSLHSGHTSVEGHAACCNFCFIAPTPSRLASASIIFLFTSLWTSQSHSGNWFHESGGGSFLGWMNLRQWLNPQLSYMPRK